MWAITCLVLFFEATFEWIKPLRPFLKFVSVKGLVFFTWMQMELIACEEGARGAQRARKKQQRERVARGGVQARGGREACARRGREACARRGS